MNTRDVRAAGISIKPDILFGLDLKPLYVQVKVITRKGN